MATPTNKSVVVFLCKELHRETVRFGNEIVKNTDFTVCIIVDQPQPNFSEVLHRHVDMASFYRLDIHNKSNALQIGRLNVITVSDQVCLDHGFVGCNIAKGKTHIDRDVIAWDKFCFLFTSVAPFCDYEFVWVFEDDVFIPDYKTIVELQSSYSGYDLVTPNDNLKVGFIRDWHWGHIFECIGPPYYYSMVAAMGLSSNMLAAVGKYVKEKSQLFHIEAMFNTLAHHSSFKVKDAFELKSVVWQGFWGLDQFMLLPNSVFHPKKDLDKFKTYRELIKQCKMKGYQGDIRVLPDFLREDYQKAMSTGVRRSTLSDE